MKSCLMKLGVIGTRGFPEVQGGIETHCLELYTRMAKENDLSITVYRRKPYLNNKNNKAVYTNIRFVDFNVPKSKNLETFVHSFFTTLHALFQHYDIVHFHNTGPGFFMPLLMLSRTKLVFTYHNVSYTQKKWGVIARIFLTLSERISLKSADFVIFISEVLQTEMVSSYPISEYSVIPNGVTINPISQESDYIVSFGLEKGKYVISVGRFLEEKGFDYLIKSFVKLRLKDCKLVIVGDSDYPTEYSERLKSFARENGVVLTGFIKGEKLRQIFSFARLFVISSFSEGHPIALLEAMSYKLDVLASDIPANLQVGLRTEDYFRVGDEDDLAEKLVMKLAVRKPRDFSDLLYEKYDWEKISNSTYSIYNYLINKK